MLWCINSIKGVPKSRLPFPLKNNNNKNDKIRYENVEGMGFPSCCKIGKSIKTDSEMKIVVKIIQK